MSGSALSPLVSGLSNGRDLAKRFADRVKCPMKPPSSMLHCLRQIPLQHFVESEVSPKKFFFKDLLFIFVLYFYTLSLLRGVVLFKRIEREMRKIQYLFCWIRFIQERFIGSNIIFWGLGRWRNFLWMRLSSTCVIFFLREGRVLWKSIYSK